MNTRYRPLILPVALLVASSSISSAEPETAKPFIDPLDVVLSLRIDELAMKRGIPSEAGLDRAARLWATAKRVETEGRVAKRSVRRVGVLSNWRFALDRWQDLQLELVATATGGGTMWGHLRSRNDVDLEKFLAGVADQLPLEGNDTGPVTSKALEELLTTSLAWLDEAAKGDGRRKPRPEHVTSIREQIKDAHEDLKWAFRFSGNAEAAEKMLHYCREAEAAKMYKMGEG